MSHVNEYGYLQQFLEKHPLNVDGRVLNVGTAHGNQPYAGLFPEHELVGLDKQSGEHVDLVCDLTEDYVREQFAAILCCSVLEHATKPWIVATNLEQMLAPGGLLYVTVPWIWRYHGYPNDYWRMSAAGVVQLFSANVRWKKMAYATQATNEFLACGKHYDTPPYRTADETGRVMLCSQFVCLIGRKQ